MLSRNLPGALTTVVWLLLIAWHAHRDEWDSVVVFAVVIFVHVMALAVMDVVDTIKDEGRKTRSILTSLEAEQRYLRSQR